MFSPACSMFNILKNMVAELAYPVFSGWMNIRYMGLQCWFVCKCFRALVTDFFRRIFFELVLILSSIVINILSFHLQHSYRLFYPYPGISYSGFSVYPFLDKSCNNILASDGCPLYGVLKRIFVWTFNHIHYIQVSPMNEQSSSVHFYLFLF